MWRKPVQRVLCPCLVQLVPMEPHLYKHLNIVRFHLDPQRKILANEFWYFMWSIYGIGCLGSQLIVKSHCQFA